jgi:5'-methylthioadenosine phosphorylase
MRLGILSGTSLATTSLFESWAEQHVDTEYGSVVCRAHGDVVLINRHGIAGTVPPHSINHRANISALQQLGVEDVLSFCSVGSLRSDLLPGTLVSCSDYVCWTPATFFDQQMRATVPQIANRLLPLYQEQVEEPIQPNCVYVQTRGPRFETPAEIRVIRQWGDVVGMTFAHEADLCAEAGLPLTSLAIVDNYANGIGDPRYGPDDFRNLVQLNREKVNRVFQSILS